MTTLAAPTFTLPAPTLDALAHFGAGPFKTVTGFRDWATTGIVVQVTCHWHTGNQAVHGLSVNPTTMETVSVFRNDATRQAAAAEHFLYALAGHTSACNLISTDLEVIGSVDHLVGLYWDQREAQDIVAARTIARTVQYLDAGFDLTDTHVVELLAVGFPVESVQDAYTAADLVLYPGGMTEITEHLNEVALYPTLPRWAVEVREYTADLARGKNPDADFVPSDQPYRHTV